MARKLPWERHGPRPRPAGRRSESRSLSPAPSATRQDGDDASARPSAPKSSRRSAAARRFRTPSTSPPPAPPGESFMIEGIQNDDQYRMVEDELLSVAQTFTAHLHAAEYQRLKAQAKSHSAAAIRSMSRPVSSAPTDAVRRKQEAQKRAEKQQHALKRAYAYADRDKKDSDTDDDDEDGGRAPWTGTSLQTLMDGTPRKEKLVPLMFGASASAGQTLVVQEDDDDDDDEDDLDGPATSRSRPAATRPVASTSRETRPLLKASLKTPKTLSTMSHRTNATNERSVTFAPGPSTAKKPKAVPPNDTADHNDDDDDDDDDDNDNDDMMDDLDAGDLMQKIRQRREREKAQRLRQRQEATRARQQQQPRTQSGRDSKSGSSLDIIPSFL